MSPMVLRRICAILVAVALSMAGFGLAASHVAQAASVATSSVATSSVAAPADCHGHAQHPDSKPVKKPSNAVHACSDICCVILAVVLPPVAPFVAPPALLADLTIQPETLRRAPPAPPPRT